MASALFTATQQRVLGLLFGQPERSFFATELISLAQAGSGAVQRELKRLAESGLVTVSRIGNQKHYQANHAAPIFENCAAWRTRYCARCSRAERCRGSWRDRRRTSCISRLLHCARPGTDR